MTFGFGSMGFSKPRWLGGGAPPAPTTWDFSGFSAETRGTGQAEIVSASVARANRVDGSNVGGLVISLAAGQYRLRGSVADWAGLGTTHMRLLTGDFSTGATSQIAGTATFIAAGAVDQTFTFASPADLILAATSNGRSFTFTKGADPVLEKVA